MRDETTGEDAGVCCEPMPVVDLAHYSGLDID